MYPPCFFHSGGVDMQALHKELIIVQVSFDVNMKNKYDQKGILNHDILYTKLNLL